MIDADGGRWHAANLPPPEPGTMFLTEEEIARAAWDDGRNDVAFLTDPVFAQGVMLGHRTIQVVSRAIPACEMDSL